jgi:hypothetical protein
MGIDMRTFSLLPKSVDASSFWAFSFCTMYGIFPSISCVNLIFYQSPDQTTKNLKVQGQKYHIFTSQQMVTSFITII